MHSALFFALLSGLVLAGMVFDALARGTPTPLGFGHLTVFLSAASFVLRYVKTFLFWFEGIVGNVVFFGVGGGSLACLLLYVVDEGQSHPRVLSPAWFVVGCLASVLNTGLSLFGMRPFREMAVLLFANPQGVANISEMLVKLDETLRSQVDTIRGSNASLDELGDWFWNWNLSHALDVESWSLREMTKIIQPAVAVSYLWCEPSVFHRFCKDSFPLLRSASFSLSSPSLVQPLSTSLFSNKD